jgi:hypothetical protein
LTPLLPSQNGKEAGEWREAKNLSNQALVHQATKRRDRQWLCTRALGDW